MKNIVLVLFLAITASLSAQFTQGEIQYESKLNVHKNLPQEMEAMKDRIPEFRTSNHVLLFNQEASMYSNKPREKKEENNEFRRRRRRGNQENDKVFHSISSGEMVESKDFFGKKFLIKGEKKNYKWQFTGKSKQVGDYLCQQAVHKDTTSTIEVWFTPMIPVAAGPEDFSGLPGLILHVDIDDGTRVISAANIINKELAENTIVIPTEGKEITREEFKTLSEEKRAEMKEMYGGERGSRRFGNRRRGGE